jgi:hypothetical protein
MSPSSGIYPRHTWFCFTTRLPQQANLMPHAGKKERASMNADKPLPLATFKNSLRVWQARWKAQQTAGPAEPSSARQGQNRLRRNRQAAPGR